MLKNGLCLCEHLEINFWKPGAHVGHMLHASLKPLNIYKKKNTWIPYLWGLDMMLVLYFKNIYVVYNLDQDKSIILIFQLVVLGKQKHYGFRIANGDWQACCYKVNFNKHKDLRIKKKKTVSIKHWVEVDLTTL